MAEIRTGTVTRPLQAGENPFDQEPPAVAEDWPRAQHGAMKGCAIVQGICPACGARSLALGAGGYVTCASLSCTQPDAASNLLDGEPQPDPRLDAALARFTEATRGER